MKGQRLQALLPLLRYMLTELRCCWRAWTVPVSASFPSPPLKHRIEVWNNWNWRGTLMVVSPEAMDIGNVFSDRNGSIGKDQSISARNGAISWSFLVLELQISRHRIINLVAIRISARTIRFDDVIRGPLGVSQSLAGNVPQYFRIDLHLGYGRQGYWGGCQNQLGIRTRINHLKLKNGDTTVSCRRLRFSIWWTCL